METLLRDVAHALGLDLLSHREAAEKSLRIRPDLAIDVSGARVGVVELKAPGMGVPGSPRWGKARDREQWEKLKALPNVLYTDGTSWAVYHYGQQSGDVAALEGDLARSGSRLRPKNDTFASLLQNFLCWKPTPPRDLRDLIKISARLCHLLRDEVAEALQRERRGNTKALFSEHLADWQEWLFPDLTDDEFVDAYAQTITFGLMLARREGVIFEGLEISDIGEKLAKRHLLVGRALSILTARPDRGMSIEERSIALQTMRRVIGVADWSRWPAAGTHHWLYEEFLEAYDPVIRRQTGAYYTPTAVTDFMTRFVDEVLRTKLGVERGLADNHVVVLDPAMGTGTFLQSVLDRVAETVKGEGGDVPASLRALLTRLVGFERQIGPYAVAELKLDQALDAYHAEAKDEDFRLYVADTLDDPNKMPLPARARMYAPLADSRRAANKVKTDEGVMVVLGNPPYRAKAKPYGKWVLDQHPGQRSLLDDFRAPGNWRHEHKLHDLAIYFWRWALWKAFESTPEQPAGVVAFITTYAYLNGPGFAGMRRYLREHADFGWIVDLSTEGHWSNTKSRVFPGVPHPVCIAIFARRSTSKRAEPALIQHLALSGDQAEKFSLLRQIQIDDWRWRDCPIDWEAPLQPTQDGSWTRNPRIEEVLPYTSLGVKCNRAWVHAPDRNVLLQRWRALINANPTEKARLMKETRDRDVNKRLVPFPGETDYVTIRDEKSPTPRIQRIGFRSFDRQYLIADQRVIDFLRSDLWRIAGPRQVYLTTQLREPLTSGPAAVFTAYVPDTHHFRGHHGGRVIPLYRDTSRTLPNVAPNLATLLRQRLGIATDDTDVMAYVAGVVAHCGYTRRFHEELRQPGVRVPLTAVPDLWHEAVLIGRRVIWLHTFGERFEDIVDGRSPRQLSAKRPAVLSPISGHATDMPDSITYDEVDQSVVIGSGRVGPVSAAVWSFEVSGMRIIKHWFDYRKRNPSGRRGGSELDELTSARWTLDMTDELRDLVAVLEGCVELEAKQADLLERIIANPLVTVTDLEDANILPPPQHAHRIVQNGDGVTLF
ncbi:type ISP restriction/modification enzyme [Planosporangium sp. 12N6]|uniref:type ISP restriction/modification enzyme n=1 Tax=Planosporangium spinosum TaxID=3402278 RepID=UPI003CF209E0